MPLKNQLKKQIDLPVWEYARPVPLSAAPTAGVSASCAADNSNFNETSGRFWYFLHTSATFLRYDTIADSFQFLTQPTTSPVTISSMRFAGAHGYYNRVISATSTTINTGLPNGRAAVGYRIRIISGAGAGQERVITSVSDPIVVDSGLSTAASSSTTALQDTSKNWIGNITTVNGTPSNAYTGSTANVNGYSGYIIRTLPYGAYAIVQPAARKILYNTNQIMTIGDVNHAALNPFSNITWTSPAGTTPYQIEYSTITVDTAWDVTPDSSSVFVIQTGGIYLLSGAAATPFYTLQYYDVLHDQWYVRTALQNIFQAAPTEASLERITENSNIWYTNRASAGTTTTLFDTTTNWTANQWAGYQLYIFSGTGRGQIVTITSNTENTLIFPALSTSPDSTSYYNIIGYDGGKSSGSNAYNTFNDSSKSWTVNRYANYGLKILYGTGAGQTRQILSNTSTALTIYGGWNVLPDNTSVYVITGFSDTMYASWGGSSQVVCHNLGTAGTLDMTTFGRVTSSGIACVLAALPCSSSHVIYEQPPVAITSLAGTTTITATTSQNHNLKVGQYVSIRGVTSAAADVYNVTGCVQITGVPSITTFTYTPNAAGTGTYAGLTALSTSSLADASKYFADNVSSATNTSITFTRATPSNINGWYVSGTNVTVGTRVTSGAGTTTVQLSGGAATPSGTIIFSLYHPTSQPTSTYSSGGGTGVATITMTANTNANINGWFITGTNMPDYTYVVSGAGTATLVLSKAMVGAASGNYAFAPPEAAGKILIFSTAAPTNATGNTTSVVAYNVGSQNGCLSGLVAFGSAPVAGITRYVLSDPKMLGAAADGNGPNYTFGIATAGGLSSMTDATAVWATATGTGSAQGTTISLSATAPLVDGWYVTGTGINIGTRIISGSGTTTLNVDIPFSGAVSGTITCCAFGPSGGTSMFLNKKLKVLSGTLANTETTISGVTPGTGNFAITGTAAARSIYSMLLIPTHGVGHEISWASNNALSEAKGRYLWMPRGGNIPGWDKLDLTTDKVAYVSTSPMTDLLTTGTYYAYDGGNRIFYNVAPAASVPTRLMYLDVDTGYVYGAGTLPYTNGTAQLGNKMDIFTTIDGFKYIIVNRQGALEVFRTLLFY